MYLTDYMAGSLKDVIAQLEPRLFNKVTGLNPQRQNLPLKKQCDEDLLGRTAN